MSVQRVTQLTRTQLEAVIRNLGLKDPLPSSVDAVFVAASGTIDVRMKPDQNHKRYWSFSLGAK